MKKEVDGAQITDDEAEAALRQVLTGDAGKDDEEEQVAVQHTPEPQSAAEPVPEEPAQAEPEQAQVETTEAAEEPQAAVDDLDSLHQRLTDLESQRSQDEKRYQERMKALQDRHSANEQILRDRFMRKSTAVDKARKVLEASLSDDGVDRAEAERVLQELRGTMNPASASYVPPPETPAAASEDQALIMNAFLNEKSMTNEEADAFGNWIRTEAGTAMSPAEQAVAASSLDGFLRLAHLRWQDAARAKENQATREDAVAAVKSVQRTQRQATRAASASPAAARKQAPAAPVTEIEFDKLTNDDISELLRQSVEQYH